MEKIQWRPKPQKTEKLSDYPSENFFDYGGDLYLKISEVEVVNVIRFQIYIDPCRYGEPQIVLVKRSLPLDTKIVPVTLESVIVSK